MMVIDVIDERMVIEESKNGRFLAIWRRGSVTQSRALVENGHIMVI